MPSIRLVAGPNGSGKTTLTQMLREEHAVPLGQYLNPDDIARHINFNALPGHITLNDTKEAAAIVARDIAIGLRDDWIRDNLSFTYESVMSHESHIKVIQKARESGYKAYLYYVCTSDPDLNKQRVLQRVAEGGHDVPSEKIINRFHRSLANLRKMLDICHRAYLFDNSKALTFVAEVTPDGHLDIIEEAFNKTQPHWLIEHVINKWKKEKIRKAYQG